MRYLAVDLGDKRTGLAVGNTVTGLATPLSVVQVPISVRGGEALLDAIAAAIVEQLGEVRPSGGWGRGGERIAGTGELVVGLPLNMDGSEGPRAALVRAFAARLAQHTCRVVHFQDERLSSVEADWRMARSGRTHKQKKVLRDAIAAAAILEDFLRTLAPTPSVAPPSNQRLDVDQVDDM